MTMPKLRTQADNLGDEISALTGTLPGGPSKTRQEFKDETDTNLLLKRFGVIPKHSGPGLGMVDFTIDLQTAMSAIESVQLAHMALIAVCGGR